MTTPVPEESPAPPDEDLTDLLSEIRLLLPGTLILVAFLIALPFNSGYTRISRLDNAVYVALFICAMISLLHVRRPCGPAPAHEPPDRPGGLQALGQPPGHHWADAALGGHHPCHLPRDLRRGKRTWPPRLWPAS